MHENRGEQNRHGTYILVGETGKKKGEDINNIVSTGKRYKENKTGSHVE